MVIVQIVFWLSVAGVMYAYAGYPAILSLMARRRVRGTARRRGRPRVTVIVAAYNEAACIGRKLASTLSQRYPWDRLDVVVVSDGSTDGTDDIVAACPDPRVTLVRQDRRSGKSVALNRGVAAAKGEILVFTDANAIFAPDAISRLAAAFDDPRVGLVSGQGLYTATIGRDARAVANGYVRYEALLKTAEGAFGFVAGADGAIYALRRSLYRDLDGAEVNDLLHPIQAALAGYRSVFDADAYTVEPPSTDARQEFGRHVRIIAQGVHLLVGWLPKLVAARRWRAVWFLTSHRILRWTSALLLVTALLTNALLAGTSSLYATLLMGQVAFYLLALTGLVAERRGRRLGRLAMPYYFCVVSAAGIGGLVRFARTGAEAVWAPGARVGAV
jgi:cellulose synthase/poly-beta-1,6-N-acetylglucosamine synthase-like glycosyltransferase